MWQTDCKSLESRSERPTESEKNKKRESESEKPKYHANYLLLFFVVVVVERALSNLTALVLSLALRVIV